MPVAFPHRWQSSRLCFGKRTFLPRTPVAMKKRYPIGPFLRIGSDPAFQPSTSA